jgi:hypothetical protein
MTSLPYPGAHWYYPSGPRVGFGEKGFQLVRVSWFWDSVAAACRQFHNLGTCPIKSSSQRLVEMAVLTIRAKLCMAFGRSVSGVGIPIEEARLGWILWFGCPPMLGSMIQATKIMENIFHCGLRWPPVDYFIHNKRPKTCRISERGNG